MCSTVKMKGKRRVPKHWKKQNTTINQLSFQTNFLLQAQGMSKNRPVFCPQGNRIPTPSVLMAWNRLAVNIRCSWRHPEAAAPALCTHPGAVHSAGGQNTGSTHWPQHPQHLGRSTRVKMPFLHTATLPAAQHCACRAERTREQRTADFQTSHNCLGWKGP